MIPGVTCLPRAVDHDGARGRRQALADRRRSSRPTTRTSAPSRIPAGPCVQTVAPRTMTARGRRERAARFAPGRAALRAAPPRGRLGFAAAVPPRGRSSGNLDPAPVDPDLRDAAVARERLPVSTARLAILPASSVPRRSDSPSWRAGMVVSAASASSAREAPRDRFAQARPQLLRLLEPVGGHREDDARRRAATRIRGGAVDAAQAFERSRRAIRRRPPAAAAAESRREGSGSAGARRPRRAGGTRRRRRRTGPSSFISRAILRRAQQRKDVRRLEDDGLPFPRPPERGPRPTRPSRPRLPAGLRRRPPRRPSTRGRRGMPAAPAPPRPSSRPGYDGARESAKSKTFGLERDVLAEVGSRDAVVEGPSARLTIAPAPRRTPERRDRGHDREAEAAVRLGDPLLDVEDWR